MRKLVMGAAAVLALLAACQAGENASAGAEGQAAAAATPPAGEAPGAGREAALAPELLDYLRGEAAKLGFPNLKTHDDFCEFISPYNILCEPANPEKAEELMRKIAFVLSERLTATKENCLRVIQEPEDWTDLRFNEGGEPHRARLGHPAARPMSRGGEARRRSRAFDLLTMDGVLASTDLPVVKESLRSARLWPSMVGAIQAIAMLDRDEGRKMARAFLWSDNFPSRAKIDLLARLSRQDPGFDAFAHPPVVVKAMLGGESFNLIHLLLDGLAQKIANTDDEGRQKTMLKNVETTLGYAETDAKKALETVAKARAAFKESLESWETLKKTSPGGQGTCPSGQAQGE